MIRLGTVLCTSRREDEEANSDPQGRLGLDGEDNQVSLISLPREKRGWDQFEDDRVMYRIDVDPVREDGSDGCLYFEASIKAKDLGVEGSEWVHKVGPWKDTMDACWHYWDEWKAGIQPPVPTASADPLRAWIESFWKGEEAGDVLVVDSETFTFVVGELDFETSVETAGDGKTKYFIYSAEVPAHSTPLFVYEREDGIRYPGFQLASEAASGPVEAEEAPILAPNTLLVEGESSVDNLLVSWTDLGKNTFDVTVKGAVSATGIHTASRIKLKASEAKDLHGWLSVYAAKLRDEYKSRTEPVS
jgi:hypothetical protein